MRVKVPASGSLIFGRNSMIWELCIETRLSVDSVGYVRAGGMVYADYAIRAHQDLIVWWVLLYAWWYMHK